MTSQVLSDIQIRNLKCKKVQYELFDLRVRGLSIRVSPRGTKSFSLLYRAGRRSRRFTLGRYPILSLAEAREKANEALRRVMLGEDPALDKASARESYATLLFPAVVDDFIKNYAMRKTRSWAQTERLLKREFLPAWRSRVVTQILRRDVHQVLDGIVARGSPSTANRALAAIRKLLNWCVERGYLAQSPCLGIRPPSAVATRERVLTDSEIARVWDAASRMHFPYGQIVLLLILTGQRRGEIVGMRWPDLDLRKGLWTISGSRNKSGRAHTIPLPKHLLTLIKSIPRMHEELVFPGRGKDTAASGYSKWKQRLDEISSVTDWTLHDIRRTFSTGMAELKVSLQVVEQILNHRSGTLSGVAGIYNRFGYVDEMREALDLWSKHVTRIVKARNRNNGTDGSFGP